MVTIDDLLASGRGRGRGPGLVGVLLANGIDRAIRDAGLTQTDVAGIMGLSQSMVSDWRRGETVPSIAQVLALDEICGKPRGWILMNAGLADPGRVEESVVVDPHLDDEGRSLVLAALLQQRERSRKRLDETKDLHMRAARFSDDLHSIVRAWKAQAPSLPLPDELERIREAASAASELADETRVEFAKALVELHSTTRANPTHTGPNGRQTTHAAAEILAHLDERIRDIIKDEVAHAAASQRSDGEPT